MQKLTSGTSMGFVYVGLTIAFTVYGQLAIKWQMNQAGDFPLELADKFAFLFRQFLSFWVLSGFAAAFLAALSWMAAMTQLELSAAYPFMSLSFVFVLVLSIVLFEEAFAWNKLIGTIIILTGLVVLSR